MSGNTGARSGIIAVAWLGTTIFTALTAAPQLKGAFIRFHILLMLGTVALVGTYIAMPRVRIVVNHANARWSVVHGRLNQAQRLYSNVVILGGVVGLLVWLDAPGREYIARAYLGFCIFVGSVDAFRWYRSASSHILGKAAISIGFAVASTLTYALARQQIASVIHVSPTNFGHSTLLVAIMAIPVMIVFAGSILYAACMVASVLVFPLLLLAKDAPTGIKDWLFAGIFAGSSVAYPVATKVFQLFFFGALGLLTAQLGGKVLPSYESMLHKRLPAIVYHLDMYHGRECMLASNEKLASLGDGTFLVASAEANGAIAYHAPVKCEGLAIRTHRSKIAVVESRP